MKMCNSLCDAYLLDAKSNWVIKVLRESVSAWSKIAEGNVWKRASLSLKHRPAFAIKMRPHPSSGNTRGGRKKQ